MSKSSMDEFDGREVECLWYACEADLIRAQRGERLLFDHRYHGTYDDNWIVRVGPDGTEKERHNISNLGGWQWAASKERPGHLDAEPRDA